MAFLNRLIKFYMSETAIIVMSLSLPLSNKRFVKGRPEYIGALVLITKYFFGRFVTFLKDKRLSMGTNFVEFNPHLVFKLGQFAKAGVQSRLH
jgi:hypothetical protein